jgi:hypothetical protein
MRRKLVGVAAGIVGAAIIAVVVASCGDSTTSPGNKTYVANLSPANEVPPKTTAGTGVATFVDLGSEIDWTLELTNMTGVVASHIHGPAAAGVNAGIMINLFLPNVATPTVNGVVAHGTITNANNANVSLDSLRTLFNNGNAYVNVHTTANGAGEIRDQVHPK